MLRLSRWATLNAGLLALSVLSVGAAAQSAQPTQQNDSCDLMKGNGRCKAAATS